MYVHIIEPMGESNHWDSHMDHKKQCVSLTILLV